MKKLIALVSVVFAFTNMSAQLKVHSNGNVSIKTTETPKASLAIGGAGERAYVRKVVYGIGQF